MQAKIIRAQAGGRIDFAGAWGDGCTLINPDNNENVLGRVCNANLVIGSVVQIKATTQSGVRIICNCYNGMLDQNSAYGTDADLFLAAARRYCLFDTSCGWEIKAESTIPPRSGLGGSAALAVPLVACVLYALSKEEKYPQLRLENNNLNYVNRAFLAQEARALEIHEIKMSSGWQDQWAAAFGGVNFIRAERDPQKPVRYEILHQESEIKTLENYLLLVHTPCDCKIQRDSNEQHRKVSEAHRFELLKVIADLGVVAKDAIMALDFKKLGQVVNDFWEAEKEFSNNAVCTSEIDWLIDEAKRCGAYGAKACGAGGPGACVVIVADQAVQELIKEILVQYPDYKILPVKISKSGLTINRV